MIIVLKNDQATAAIEELKQHFGSQHEIFVHNNRVAIQNADPNDLTPAEQTAAQEIITDVPAAVQASRLFHPEDTIIKTPHSTIGGKNFTLMAGPCSVESAEHILKMAQVVKNAGANGLIVEIHDDPAHAFSDGAQALKPNEFNEMVVKTNAVRQALQSIE